MRMHEKKPYILDGRTEAERPPKEVGLRDRIAHFTWYAEASFENTGCILIFTIGRGSQQQ